MKKSKLKVQNWEDHLTKYLMSRSDKPLVWGKNDCVTFVADAILVMTGEDLMIEYRGRYDTRGQAAKIIGEEKLSLREAAEDVFEEYGIEKTDSPGYGDPVCVEVENADPVAARLFGGVTFGICCKHNIVAIPGRDQLLFTDKFRLVSAWKLE